MYLRFNPHEITFDTQTIKIHDRGGTILWELSKDNAVRNTQISIDSVPKFCKEALISIEDNSFYDNIGIDIKGVARLIISAFSGNSRGGGSTISQQVIKNSYGSFYERNALDKINEIILSIKLNNKLSKDEILELYLNNVYFGQINYGIESAAQDYFGKSTQLLNEAECSYLMGIPQYPGVYNPYGDIETGFARQREVLDSMVRNNLISEAKRDELLAVPLDFRYTGYSIRAPHFIEYVQDKYKIFKESGFESQFNNQIPQRIETHYDYSLHTSILNLMKEEIQYAPDNAASFVINNKGEILTMIGSKDYFDESNNGKFNSALGLRQPGTLYNPLIYSYALKFHSPTERYPNLSFGKDVERGVNKFENLRISNFGLPDSLDISIGDALSQNYTVPAVRIIQEYEYPRIQNYLVESGITKQEYDNWCNDVLNLEGCEATLVDITSSLSNIINPERIKIKDIFRYGSSDSMQEFETFDQPIVQNDTVLEPEIFTKHLKGYTINKKDFWLYFYNEKFFAGFWFGNTDGKEIENYDLFIENVDVQKFIDILESNI